jgi:ribosomal protein L7/L12
MTSPFKFLAIDLSVSDAADFERLKQQAIDLLAAEAAPNDAKLIEGLDPIAAIKKLRAVNGYSLREAKAAYDRMVGNRHGE